LWQVRAAVSICQAAVLGAVVELLNDRPDGQVAGDFPGGRASHAVADDKQATVGASPVRVFVQLADTADIGSCPDVQSH
jgi:hypothetical protein